MEKHNKTSQNKPKHKTGEMLRLMSRHKMETKLKPTMKLKAKLKRRHEECNTLKTESVFVAIQLFLIYRALGCRNFHNLRNLKS